MTGTPGRPLSAELSEQLVSVAVDILAEEGWGRLNSDRIAARARAGKAGIYRRWPTMAALARTAVSRFDLVPSPAEGNSVREDLADVVARWTRPLDREERAVASLVGAARHEEDLRAGLDDALVRPLARVVAEIGARAADR
ncbi:MAG: TetR family transcriptional regulator, partial [Blastococcus sp.]